MSGELELPDDFDLANALWESLQKGPEVGAETDNSEVQQEEKPVEESTPPEEEKKDADEHTGTEGEMASRQSDKEQQEDQPGGPGPDESGGDGDTGGAPTGGVIVHTVAPTSSDTAPSKPDRTSRTKSRHGPKFKRHRYWREHSTT